MQWARSIGTAGAVLAATGLATAGPLYTAENHHGSGPSGAPSAVPTTVRPPPQSRESSRSRPAREVEPPRWYGWQTLAFDGAVFAGSITALVVAGDTDVFESLAWTPAVAFAVGGPVIHLVHREPWRALGSLGLRGGLPALGGAFGIGILANCPPPDGEYGSCGLGEFAVGVALGVLAASLIDGFALARESAGARDVALSISPFVSSDGSTGELRLQGRF
jgi:hypothetical protein